VSVMTGLRYRLGLAILLTTEMLWGSHSTAP